MKAMVTIHDVQQGTPEWQELRRGKYTGSNAHKLLKFGKIPYSRTEDTGFRGNYYTKRGQALEPEAIELYEAITGHAIRRPGLVTNSRYPGCAYSPDGFDEAVPSSVCLLEVKCFNKAKHLAIAKGEIPLEVLAQVHFGLFICDLGEARLILYNPDLDVKLALKILTIKRSRSIDNNFKRILSQEVVHAGR